MLYLRHPLLDISLSSGLYDGPWELDLVHTWYIVKDTIGTIWHYWYFHKIWTFMYLCRFSYWQARSCSYRCSSVSDTRTSIASRLIQISQIPMQHVLEKVYHPANAIVWHHMWPNWYYCLWIMSYWCHWHVFLYKWIVLCRLIVMLYVGYIGPVQHNYCHPHIFVSMSVSSIIKHIYYYWIDWMQWTIFYCLGEPCWLWLSLSIHSWFSICYISKNMYYCKVLADNIFVLSICI